MAVSGPDDDEADHDQDAPQDHQRQIEAAHEQDQLPQHAEAGRPVDCALSGSVPGKLAPGCSRLTITRPSSSEMKEAETNQPMVLAKTRPSFEPEPIWAMPPTRVANTSGAMIILIRRRNSMAIRFTSAAISTRLSGI